MHSLMHGKIFRSIFFSGALVMFSRNLWRLTSAFKKVVARIDLHENGKLVDLVFVDNSKLVVEVWKIERLSEKGPQFNNKVKSTSKETPLTKINS